MHPYGLIAKAGKFIMQLDSPSFVQIILHAILSDLDQDFDYPLLYLIGLSHRYPAGSMSIKLRELQPVFNSGSFFA
jgi:hypothetical protein